MNPTRLLLSIDSPAFFAEAAAAYAEAKGSYYEAREDVAENASEAERIRGQLKDLEATAIVNGYANGGNEAQRAAALRAWLCDPENLEAEPYRKAQVLLRTYELAKSQAENVADEAANELSLQRRRMDAHTANVNRMAAVEGNRGHEASR